MKRRVFSTLMVLVMVFVMTTFAHASSWQDTYTTRTIRKTFNIKTPRVLINP